MDPLTWKLLQIIRFFQHLTKQQEQTISARNTQITAQTIIITKFAFENEISFT